MGAASGIELGDKKHGAAIGNHPGQRVDDWEVPGSRVSTYDGIAFPVYCNRGRPINGTTSQVGRINQVGAVTIEFSPDYARDLNPSEIWAQKKSRSSLI